MQEIPLGLTFDDVILSPQYSEISSRLNGEISLGTRLGPNLDLLVPLISSNMDTITGNAMAIEMARLGGLGILHRFMSLENNLAALRDIPPRLAVISIGVGDEGKKRLNYLLENSFNIGGICIDIAHGHCKAMIDQIVYVKGVAPSMTIIAGNVATNEGAADLYEAGAHVIKVGVGPGALCETRVVTGCGVPQLTAIMDCATVRSTYKDLKIIADGGIRGGGDCVKSLAAGADAVMCGSLFSGTNECPGDEIVIDGKHYKSFRGSASAAAQQDWKGYVSVTEGESCIVPCKGPVGTVVNELIRGIRSGFSYLGAHNIDELRKSAYFIRQTQAGAIEGSPHLLNKL